VAAVRGAGRRSNVVIAATYAAAGAFFRDRGGFSPAIVLSGTIPLLAALLARRLLPKAAASNGTGNGDGPVHVTFEGDDRDPASASKKHAARSDN
jgi:hypothetical protein